MNAGLAPWEAPLARQSQAMQPVKPAHFAKVAKGMARADPLRRIWQRQGTGGTRSRHWLRQPGGPIGPMVAASTAAPFRKACPKPSSSVPASGAPATGATAATGPGYFQAAQGGTLFR